VYVPDKEVADPPGDKNVPVFIVSVTDSPDEIPCAICVVIVSVVPPAPTIADNMLYGPITCVADAPPGYVPFEHTKDIIAPTGMLCANSVVSVSAVNGGAPTATEVILNVPPLEKSKYR
jgi:hypothetical protein